MHKSLGSLLSLDVLQDLFVRDEVIDSWFLMSSWVPITSIVAVYLIFVSYLGPRWMENRKPYELKSIILSYNLMQALFNGYLVTKMFTTTGAISYLYHHSCMPLPNKNLNPLFSEFTNMAFLFFISKLFDMLDTVFFVLKKKSSQISFLHVYHHSTMPLNTWAFLKFFKGEAAVYVGFLNAMVHVVMYSYYFLSALGPGVQKYLWWKKYITRFQLAQFVFFVLHQSSLIIWNCDQPRALAYYTLLQALLMIVLFGDFYYKTYVVKEKPL